jgi:hypothetical protein
MFKRIRRKLATAPRKRKRDPEVYAVARAGVNFASDESPSPSDPRKRSFPKEHESPPQLRTEEFPDAQVKKVAKPMNVSHPQLDSDDRTSPSAAIRPPPEPKDIESDNLQCRGRAQNGSCQQEAEESLTGNEDMKFITLQTGHQKLQALLIPQLTYQRTQALIHARQDLRAADSELATTAAELNNLIVAKSELEEQNDYEIPGAFFDDDAYTDRERRRLLMATIEKKSSFAKQTLEYLEMQKPRLEADLEALQEQFLDDLERAVRDDKAANALGAKLGVRKSHLFCGQGEIGGHSGL